MPTLDEIIKAYGQIPDFCSFKRPMFIGPHPDDIEFGCGGLVSKYKEKGIPVTFVVATEGGAGTVDPLVTPKMLASTRREESLASAAFLGVGNVEFLDFEDGGMYEIEDVVQKLAPIILKYNPDIIFAPDSRLRTECHWDHIKVGEAARLVLQIVPHPETLRRHKVSVEGVSIFPGDITLALYFTDDPNTKVEISEKNLSDKIESLNLHKSQMADPSIGLLLDYFKLKAMKLGEGTSTGFAEDYQVLVPLTQHVYSEGIHY